MDSPLVAYVNSRLLIRRRLFFSNARVIMHLTQSRAYEYPLPKHSSDDLIHVVNQL